MFDRTRLSVHLRAGRNDGLVEVRAYLGGELLLATEGQEPGPNLFATMDKMEKFLRFVREGVEFEASYLAAFPS